MTSVRGAEPCAKMCARSRRGRRISKLLPTFRPGIRVSSLSLEKADLLEGLAMATSWGGANPPFSTPQLKLPVNRFVFAFSPTMCPITSLQSG